VVVVEQRATAVVDEVVVRMKGVQERDLGLLARAPVALPTRAVRVEESAQAEKTKESAPRDLIARITDQRSLKKEENLDHPTLWKRRQARKWMTQNTSPLLPAWTVRKERALVVHQKSEISVHQVWIESNEKDPALPQDPQVPRKGKERDPAAPPRVLALKEGREKDPVVPRNLLVIARDEGLHEVPRDLRALTKRKAEDPVVVQDLQALTAVQEIDLAMHRKSAREERDPPVRLHAPKHLLILENVRVGDGEVDPHPYHREVRRLLEVVGRVPDVAGREAPPILEGPEAHLDHRAKAQNILKR